MDNAIKNNQKPFYTIEELRVQGYGGLISRSTIVNMVNSGKIPAERVMSRILIPAWFVEKMRNVAYNGGE